MFRSKANHDHWLPIIKRIKYKLCLLIFKCLNKCAPPYLIDTIRLKTPTDGPVTRSAMDKTRLHIQVGKKVIGDKSFAVAGPSIWNSLPKSIRESSSINLFKKKLKTHLYNVHWHFPFHLILCFPCIYCCLLNWWLCVCIVLVICILCALRS